MANGSLLALERQTANVSLYHVTDFSLYFHFAVHYNYREISRFPPVSSIRIVLSCFYLLISYFENFSTWTWRLPFAVNATLNLSINIVFWLLRYGINERLLRPKVKDIKEAATECISLPVSVPTSKRLSTPHRIPICLPVEGDVCARVKGLGWGCLTCLRLPLFWFLEDVGVSVVVTSLATLRVRTWDVISPKAWFSLAHKHKHKHKRKHKHMCKQEKIPAT